MNRIKIPHILKKMYQIFNAAGFQAYLVGGAVRDMLRGKPPHDYDVATDAPPETVMRLFHRVIPTGIAHGTVTVRLWGQQIETTTFRTESGYTDGRHPDTVSYAGTIEEDLSRRDFTINAIAVNLKDGSVVDPFRGRDDLKKKIIRTVGAPAERFSEDGLRPIRAVRFAAQLNFSIEPQTYAALFDEKIQAKTASVSIERFRDEFSKLLGAEKPSVALRMLEESGLMRIFLLELLAGRGCVQKDIRGYHHFDVLDHLYYACDAAPCDNLKLRLAALLHDVGKPATRTVEQTEDGEYCHFYRHEIVGADTARNILTRLRYPNALVEAVAHLIREHMFYYEPHWSDAAVRRFAVRVTPEALTDLYRLRIADMTGKYNEPPDAQSPGMRNLFALEDRVNAVLAEKSALSLKDLAVNGKDLLAAGIPAGKEIGRILHELLDAVLDDPAQNNREMLLKIASALTKG